MLKRISITGPESTGKSMLAKRLAEHFHTLWVPEFAREYLGSLGRDYNYDDILEIAKNQLIREESKAIKARDLLFCDTDFIVTKIWCEVKYGKCHNWIKDTILDHKYDIYLLCDIDLPWEEDPLREHPDNRKYLFDLYEGELKKINLPYKIVRGQGNDRLKNAINIIIETLK